MNKQELRIGNFVTQQGSNFVEEVTIELLCRKDVILSPISITEEWLLRLGFKQCSWDKREFWLGLHENSFFCYFKFYKNGRVDCGFSGKTEKNKTRDTVFLKYVHQLQNLYFALTSEELELK